MADDLRAYLIDLIKVQGPISLGRYLDIVMTHPRLGYYASESVHPIGKQGDFITAPEVSQMFGEMIGAWIIDVWKQMGGSDITLIECGPGRGTLMADIFRVASNVPSFMKAVRLRFIETSESLRESQRKAVQNYIDTNNVSWNDTLTECKEPCIIIGNEFLDALPIEQVIRRDNSWYQHTVELDSGGGLAFGEQEMEESISPHLPCHAKEGEIYEVSPERSGFIKDCLRVMGHGGGVALFIDYGYEKTSFGDTLQAVKRHKYADVLADVGECDITSHVDFDALNRVIKKHGGRSEHITTQGTFLKRLGIGHRAQILKKGNSHRKQDIDVALDRLVSSDQMGDLFKIFCFYNEKAGENLRLSGFQGV